MVLSIKLFLIKNKIKKNENKILPKIAKELINIFKKFIIK